MSKPLTAKQQAFLDAYRTYGIVRIAAAKSGVSRELHYNALRISETYRQALAAIEKEHALQLEEQARTIALDQGVPEPVFYGRKLVGFKRRFSDKLLILLLQANHPEKFRRPKAPRKRRPPDNGTIFPSHRTARTRREPIERPSPRKPSLEALLLEEEARTIALEGLPEPVYYGRQIVGIRRKYSDRLLICLLEANHPRKFRFPRAPARRREKRRPDKGAILWTPRFRLIPPPRPESDYVRQRRRRTLCSRFVTAGCAKVRGACDTTPRSDTTHFPWFSTVSLRRAKGRGPSALPTRASALDPVGERRWVAQRTPVRQARPPTFTGDATQQRPCGPGNEQHIVP